MNGMSLGMHVKHTFRKDWSTCLKLDSKLGNEHDWGGALQGNNVRIDRDMSESSRDN